MTLLERVKMLCEKRGVSINRFEKEAGLTRGSVAKWDDHAPSGQKLEKAAQYFGVSVNYLLTGKSGLIARRTDDPFVDVSETYDEFGNLIGTETNYNTLFTGTDEENAELVALLEDLRTRDDMRMLFKLAHGATPEDVAQAVKIIEALRK